MKILINFYNHITFIIISFLNLLMIKRMNDINLHYILLIEVIFTFLKYIQKIKIYSSIRKY